ncbi:proteasome assembly chaperone family protein [Halobaculum sp. P14]|uniref:proteasome assembly chaperone family protein n=1 Tax=Halobaculum sp. P14 TaxID=3421638 RepID=UPI003EBD039A
MVTVETAGDASLDDPILVEGLPGIGLAGKIAADHVRDVLDARQYGELTGDEIPQTAVFTEGDRGVASPLRLYVDEADDVVVLAGDAPVPPAIADDVADAVNGWAAEVGATPLYLSGLPTERESTEVPDMYGVATGGAGDRLDDAGVDAPEVDGAVQGPAGALLTDAHQRGLGSCGLIVETTPRFPDPEGAHVLVRDGINPVAGVDVDTDPLVESAEEIMEQRKRLAQQLQQSGEQQSRAEQTGMFQ